jgi:hypothetical protein
VQSALHAVGTHFTVSITVDARQALDLWISLAAEDCVEGPKHADSLLPNLRKLQAQKASKHCLITLEKTIDVKFVPVTAILHTAKVIAVAEHTAFVTRNSRLIFKTLRLAGPGFRCHHSHNLILAPLFLIEAELQGKLFRVS